MSYNGKKLLNNPTMWTLGLTYGEVDTDMPGSYSFGIRYVDADYVSNMLGATGLDSKTSSTILMKKEQVYPSGLLVLL